MYTTLTKVLLSAAVIGGGIGAGSLVAGATDTVLDTSTLDTPTTAPAEETVEPNGLQTVDTTTDGADGAENSDGRRGCGNSEAVAEVLGLTVDEVRAQRDAGSSVAEIATAQGVEVDAVVQAIVDDKAERLDERVAAGDITEAEAAERLAGYEERAENRVTGDSDG